MKKLVFFDSSRCIGCGACVKACPHGCISLESEKRNESGFHPAFLCLPKLCAGCEACVRVCPVQAIGGD